MHAAEMVVLGAIQTGAVGWLLSFPARANLRSCLLHPRQQRVKPHKNLAERSARFGRQALGTGGFA